MKDHMAKIIIVVLLVIVVGLPVLLRPSDSGGHVGHADEKLILISPHNEQIRHEFSTAFNRWRVDQGMEPIAFDWRSGGGTSDLRKQVLSQFEQLAKDGRESSGVGADLFFGGGEYEHNKLAKGVRTTRDGEQVQISATVPIELPPGLLEEAFPQPDIGGEKLYHPDLYWVGAALSSFGIVYNLDLVELLDLPEPTTWTDLGDPRYQRQVALSDPGKSGSIAATYNTILRRLGWNEGWHELRKVYANARYFTASSSKVPVDVSQGEAAAGMCIDFYGRFQAGAVADPDGTQRVGYIDPPGVTSTTADPISILRGAPSPELANQFVVWLLGPEAQQLWQREVGTPEGPELFALRRQPIRRDAFTAENRSYWADPQIDPFGEATAIPRAMPNFFSLIASVTHAMAIDIHDDLVEAWAALNAIPSDDPRRAEMETLFFAMPEDLTVEWPDSALQTSWPEAVASPEHPLHETAARALDEFMDGFSQRYREDPDLAIADRLRWTLFFRDNYREIVALEHSNY